MVLETFIYAWASPLPSFCFGQCESLKVWDGNESDPRFLFSDQIQISSFLDRVKAIDYDNTYHVVEEVVSPTCNWTTIYSDPQIATDDESYISIFV